VDFKYGDAKSRLHIRELIDRKHGALTQSIVLIIITTQKPEGFSNGTGTQFVRGGFFFVQSATGENCLVVPPICLIVRALHYIYKNIKRKRP
jgi:hypothetical protein